MNLEETTPGASAITPGQNPKDTLLPPPSLPRVYAIVGSSASTSGDNLFASYLAQFVSQIDEIVKSIKAKKERNTEQESLN